MQALGFRQLADTYAIVRLPAVAPIPDWARQGEFTSVTRTADELSIVCRAENLPGDVNSPHAWMCLKLEGPFAFSQTGVLLSFLKPLSENRIPIFAISTFDTDYVLIQEEFAAAAFEALEQAGHKRLA